MFEMRDDRDDAPSREPSCEGDPAVRQAWLEEAERRMDLVRSGKMRLIDAEEALADPEFNV
jgi:hypothetical protein